MNNYRANGRRQHPEAQREPAACAAITPDVRRATSRTEVGDAPAQFTVPQTAQSVTPDGMQLKQ